MSYQIKVEYGEHKWISFLVNVSDVHSGNYNFASLVADIVRRCPSLSYLTTTTMRLRYLDDEENYVNIDFGDGSGFQDMWPNAVQVENREYKRIKLKATELNSPYISNPNNTSSTSRSNSAVPTSTSETCTTRTNRYGARKQLQMETVSHSIITV